MSVNVHFLASDLTVENGVFKNMPSWLKIFCSTDNRTVQQSSNSVAVVGANAARAFNNGSGYGLLAEPTCFNRQLSKSYLTWTESGSPDVSLVSSPVGDTSAVRVVDANAGSSDYIYDTTSLAIVFSQHNISAWTCLRDGTGTAQVKVRKIGSADYAIITWSGADDDWTFRSDNHSSGGVTTPAVHIIPALSTADTGTLDVWGIQVEDRLYPTSWIGYDDNNNYREADTLMSLAEAIFPSGYCNASITFRPHFASTEISTAAKYIVYLNSTNYVSVQNGVFKLTVNGNTLSSSTCTWSRHQEITLDFAYDGVTKDLTVSGCTTGNGSSSSAEVSGAITLPNYVYFFGTNTGCQEGFDLLELNANNTIDLWSSDREGRWDAAFQDNSSGVFFNMPDWIKVKNGTRNQIVRTGANSVELLTDNDKPKIYNKGSGPGLLGEPFTKNIILEKDLNNWSKNNTPIISSELNPLGEYQNIKVQDDSSGTIESVYYTTSQDAVSHTLSLWMFVESYTSFTSSVAKDSGTSNLSVSIADERRWVFGDDNGTTATTEDWTLIPLNSSSLTGSTRFWGVQVEERLYPTSYIGYGDNYYREEDLIFAIGEVLSGNGYLDLDFVYRPHYAYNELTSDHNLIWFNNSVRFYYDQSASSFVFTVGGVTVTKAVTFSRHQELKFNLLHDGNEVTLTVIGATTGSGSSTGSAASAFYVPPYVYLFGTNEGVEEAASLVAINSNVTAIGKPDKDDIKWNAAWENQGNDGTINTPSWLLYQCDTSNRTVKVGSSRLAIDLDANIIPAHAATAGLGACAEPDTINLVPEQDPGNWFFVSGLPTVPTIGPDGKISAFVVEDNDALSFEYYHDRDVLGVLSGSHNISAWFADVTSESFRIRTRELSGLEQLATATVDGGSSGWSKLSGSYNSTAPSTDVEVELFPARLNVGDVGSGSVAFIQVEDGRLYPTSFINGSRATSTMFVPSVFVIDESGYLDIEIWIRPHYAYDKLDGYGHYIWYLDSDNNLFYDDATNVFVLTIQGTELSSLAGSWTSYSSIFIKSTHSSSELSLVIYGAGAADGTYSTSAQSALDPDSFSNLYLGGTSLGTEHSLDFLYIDTSLSVTDVDGELLDPGAGISGVGLTPAGYGQPNLSPVIKRKIWKQENTDAGQVRYIDPTTGDYKFNDDGLLVGGDGVEQQVYLALVTVRGSSAVANLGQGFTSIQTIGDNVESVITEEVRLALQSLIASGTISLSRVFVDRYPQNPTRLRILVEWKDLTKGNPNVAQILI